MNDLRRMFDAQLELQITSYGKNPKALEGEERLEYIRWNVLALEDELHEAMAECGWKPWASSKHVNEHAFKSELVDAWHFFMNLWLVSGGTYDELVSMYEAKRRKNERRQAEGYDGVRGKCPGCKRALDDSAVLCEAGQSYYKCASIGTGDPLPLPANYWS